MYKLGRDDEVIVSQRSGYLLPFFILDLLAFLVNLFFCTSNFSAHGCSERGVQWMLGMRQMQWLGGCRNRLQSLEYQNGVALVHSLDHGLVYVWIHC